MKNLLLLAISMFLSIQAFTHCEVPCGIYDDQLRISLIKEHIGTIEKSIKNIESLGSSEIKDYNQIVRWINTKESHANEIQEIVSQYFLTQRIKKDSEQYTEKLEILHQILIYSMKCKQSLDLTNIEKLNSLIGEFENLYFDHKH